MKAIVGHWGTCVRMSGEEAKEICKLGQGKDHCAFLAVDGGGFNCVRMDSTTSSFIFYKLREDAMNAQGQGGWKGCYWEGQV